MIIIGERINSSRRRIAEAIETGEVSLIQKEAMMQVEAGADYLDLNAGIFGEKEIEYLKWLIRVVEGVTDKPLCIDSTNLETFAAVLPSCRGRTLLNSVTPQEISAVIPLLREYPCNIVALCLSEQEPIADSRAGIASRIIGTLTSYGLDLDRIYIDAVVKPISTDPNSAIIALNTIEELREKYPEVHTLCGVSNISFGLPARKQINGTFLIMALARGLDTLIVDPCDKQLMANIIAARLLLGQDEYCLNYIKAYREGKLSN